MKKLITAALLLCMVPATAQAGLFDFLKSKKAVSRQEAARQRVEKAKQRLKKKVERVQRDKLGKLVSPSKKNDAKKQAKANSKVRRGDETRSVVRRPSAPYPARPRD